jgi:hypothetical protein
LGWVLGFGSDEYTTSPWSCEALNVIVADAGT